MSEFFINVVQLDQIEKHPNADALDIATVHYGYPCITKLGQFKVGSTAVYIPVDALVPVNDPRFEFLKPRTSANQAYYRVRAMKLRGVFSMGLLIEADPSWEVGKDVKELLGIKKYDPEFVWKGGPTLSAKSEQEPDPGFIPEYTDIEGYRRYGHCVEEGEEIVLTEKVHGMNGRWAYWQDRLWAGSHHQIKRNVSTCVWWRIAEQYGLEEKLKARPGYIIYGEAYGQVQDLRYGTTMDDPLRLGIFDTFSIEHGRYLNWDEHRDFLQSVGLSEYQVPVLYRGPWKKELVQLAEGNSVIPGANNIKEGWVLRPVNERYDRKIGRFILKLIGSQYLTRKEPPLV